MALTGNGYMRALGAEPTALTAVTVGAVRATRIKLLFLDEVGAFVRRNRGFSACWYLVPATARRVGDLLHEISEEFELRERCPLGIEVLLDGFHVLSNQEIGMVRDNDTLAVQCVAFVGEQEPLTKRLGTSDERVKRGREDETIMDNVPSKKKSKREKSVETTPTTANTTTVGKKKRVEPVAPTETKTKAAKQVPIVATPDIDSSSDDDSSSSSDSSSEEEAEFIKPPPVKPTKEAFRQVIKQTVKSMKEGVSVLSSSSNAADSSSSSSSDSDSDSSSSSSDDDKPAAKTPIKNPNGKNAQATETRTRRRRRPRRRPKNGTGAADANGSKLPAQTKEKSGNVAGAAAPSTKEVRPLRIRGVPPTNKMNHVRFDASQKSAETQADLTKYGPESANSRPKSTLPKPSTSSQSAANTEANVSTAKKPVKEMWKRPYAIISSIHDAKETTNGTPTLESLLSTFPSKPADASLLPTPSGLQTDDIVAYKTLTLCMETFQPVVSDWLCGQVVDVLADDRSVTIIPYTWKTSNASLAWAPSEPHNGEDACITVSQDEISELRYLHCPTKSHLGA